MKNRLLGALILVLVLLAGALAAISRDALYIESVIAFFALCIAYAEWCERL
jgi:hypothetical protein